MRQGRNCFVITEVWTGHHPLKMHYLANSVGSLPSWDLDDPHSVAPSLEEFAWTKTLSSSQQSVWMTISKVFKACSELIKYSCNEN